MDLSVTHDHTQHVYVVNLTVYMWIYLLHTIIHNMYICCKPHGFFKNIFQVNIHVKYIVDQLCAPMGGSFNKLYPGIKVIAQFCTRPCYIHVLLLYHCNLVRYIDIISANIIKVNYVNMTILTSL